MKIYGVNCCPEIAAFLVVFVADIEAALLAILFLILADTFTGIWSSVKKNQYISSRRAGRILSKLILYPLAVIVSKVTQEYLSPEIPWVQVTAGIIAVVEIKSIFENMSTVLGFDLWARVKDALWKGKNENKDS